jgi:hypothetical protein
MELTPLDVMFLRELKIAPTSLKEDFDAYAKVCQDRDFWKRAYLVESRACDRADRRFFWSALAAGAIGLICWGLLAMVASLLWE